MRISPLNEANAPLGTMREERVNVWPVAYHQAGATSILWPMIDIDDQGFAIRPLYNKEGDDHSILFPFCAWNPVHKDGWAVPAYWDDGEYGVFPLFHRGDDWGYAGPYWYERKGELRRGIFPLLLDGREFNYIGPFWWRGKDRLEAYGLFPLAAKGKETSFVGPLWKQGSWTDPDVAAGLFPLAYWQRDRVAGLLPVYHQERQDDGTFRAALGLGILAYVDNRSDTDYTRWIAPGYVDRKDGNDRTRLILPLWFSRRAADSATSALVPFYLHARDGNGDLLLTPLGGARPACRWHRLHAQCPGRAIPLATGRGQAGIYSLGRPGFLRPQNRQQPFPDGIATVV